MASRCLQRRKIIIPSDGPMDMRTMEYFPSSTFHVSRRYSGISVYLSLCLSIYRVKRHSLKVKVPTSNVSMSSTILFITCWRCLNTYLYISRYLLRYKVSLYTLYLPINLQITTHSSPSHLYTLLPGKRAQPPLHTNPNAPTRQDTRTPPPTSIPQSPPHTPTNSTQNVHLPLLLLYPQPQDLHLRRLVRL
jgi:hypothetical protein